MRSHFYAKIAASNLVNQRRFYVPHILTGAGLMGSFYIVRTLAADDRLSQVRGGSYLPTFMGMGTFIMAFLSLILLLYTNSFLMKQRKREFGLYNVLGMEKRHVMRVLFFETLYSAVIAIIGGLLFGVIMYKLCSLIVCRLLNTDIVLGFYFIKASSLLWSGAFFALLYLLTFVINSIRISRMKVVDLLMSRHVGEKEPKVKWLTLVVGIVTLTAGYVLALTTKNPLQAVGMFFVAVILVIIGTYCLFVSGTIWILKRLKKHEAYYYTKKHMPAISGLLYRMKQNAVGLASIAVMGTGVIIMVSTTFGLYAGLNQSMEAAYPQHWYVDAAYDTKDGETIRLTGQELKSLVQEAADKENVAIASMEDQTYLMASYRLAGDELQTDQDRVTQVDMTKLATVIYLTEDTYNRLTAGDLRLGDGEIALCTYDAEGEKYFSGLSSLKVAGREWTIKERAVYFPIRNPMNYMTLCFGVVVPDEAAFDLIYNDEKEAYGDNASSVCNQLAVTFANEAAATEAGDKLSENLRDAIRAYVPAQRGGEEGGMSWSSDSKWDMVYYVYGMYGSMLFLGCLLGLVFLFATALIIYYKQVSEGYEDRVRFQIMQKIGMSSRDVRKTISSQVKLVFFLPLAVAGVHTVVALPILLKLLRVLLLSETSLFLICTLITFAFFALIYTFIYSMTTKVYYKIVY